jgi:hypothetical protein
MQQGMQIKQNKRRESMVRRRTSMNIENDETEMLAESFRRAEWELSGPMATHNINL